MFATAERVAQGELICFLKFLRIRGGGSGWNYSVHGPAFSKKTAVFRQVAVAMLPKDRGLSKKTIFMRAFITHVCLLLFGK